MRQVFHFSIELAHTENEKTCEDKGLKDLKFYQDCVVAVTYATTFNSKARYGGWGIWQNYPKGCYIADDGSMYFNTHSTGKPLSNTRTICKAGDH